MRTYLCNRVKREKKEKERENTTWVRTNSMHPKDFNGKTIWSTSIRVNKDDLEKMGTEEAITLASERPARLAKAQLERKELEKAKEQANILECTTSKAELGETYLELKGVPPHLAN